MKLAVGNNRIKRTIGPLSDASLLTLSNLLRLVSLLGTTIFLGRSLGPESLGLFSLSLAAVSIMQAVSVAGLAGAAVHKLLQHRGSYIADLRIISHARMIVIPMVFALGGAVMFLIPGMDAINIWTVLAFLVGYALGAYDVADLSMTARGRFADIAVRRMAVVASIAPVKFWLASSGHLDATMLALAIETALWQLILFPGASIRLSFVMHLPHEAKGALYQVWTLRALWGSSIVSAVAQRVDLFIVGGLLSLYAAGQYSTASRPIEATIVVATSLITVLFNAISKSSSSSVKYAEQASQASRKTFWTAMVIALGLATVGPTLLILLYGTAFSEAAALLPLYSLCVVFLFMRQLISRLLIVEGRYGLSLASNATAVAVNVIFNVLLIPILGLHGAALAAVVSHPVSLLIAFLPHPQGRRLLALTYGSVVLNSSRMTSTTEYLIQHRRVL